MSPPWFRPDLDGLRAVAIVLVVAFHAHIPGFEGGFIGVDVFFVLSGWLITRNLLREAETSGRVDLLGFWARRIRRLVPGLALMVVVTMIGSVLILSELEVEDVAEQAVAAALYVSNVLFAVESQGYFGADVEGSPFLHTWSLGVEEQFYLFWPVLAVLAVWVVSRRSRLLRPVLGGVYVILAVTSFVIANNLTDERSTWAFFGLQSRVWQFAAAGLIATIGVPKLLSTPTASYVSGAAGLAFLAIATVGFDGETPYPGTAALIPVAGTLLLLVAGTASERPSAITRGLSTAPMQGLGRVSYSWYLWHWPVIILATVYFDEDDALLRSVAALAALVIAYLAYRFVENPVRFASGAWKGKRRTAAVGLGFTAAAIIAAFGAAQLSAAGPTNPVLEQVESARSLEGRWPSCVETTSAGGVAYCTRDDDTGDQLVLLIGDSKAFGWHETVAAAVDEIDARLAAQLFPSCPSIAVDIKLTGPFAGPEQRQKCRDNHAAMRELVLELQPDLVLLSQGSHYLGIGELLISDEVPPLEEQQRIWAEALEAEVRWFDSQGIPLAVLADNPAFAEDPLVCVAREQATEPCTPSRSETLALIDLVRPQELEILSRLEVTTLDLVEAICSSAACPLGTSDYLHYYDSNHLSFASMSALQPEVVDLLEEGLEK